MYNKFLVGYSGGWWGVVRTALWSITFLWLFSLHLPPFQENLPLQTALKGTHDITPMLTQPEDARGERGDVKIDPARFNIAWLTDSTGTLLSAKSDFDDDDSEKHMKVLPALVIDELSNTRHTSNFSVELYCRLGLRIIEDHVFALMAARHKPDLIVMSLNDMWAFSQYSITNMPTTSNSAAVVWAAHPRYWIDMLALNSPSQNLWPLVSLFPVLRDASPVKEYYLENPPWPFSTLSPNAVTPAMLRRPKTNVTYWIDYVMTNGKIDTSKMPEDQQALLRYMLILQYNEPENFSVYGPGTIVNILEDIRRSGIPALIYLAPLSSAYHDDPATKASIGRMIDALDQLKQRYDGTNVHLIDTIPKEVHDSITFRHQDGVHMVDDGIFHKFLADQIWEIIKDNPKLHHRGSKK